MCSIYTKNHTACSAALYTCASEKGLEMSAGAKESWGVEEKMCEEMCQRANDLENAKEIAAEGAPDDEQKAAILKKKENSFVAWAKEACVPFNEDKSLPVA